MHKCLGIHCGHNASAAVVVDGAVEGILQEERLTRNKNQTGYPFASLDTLLGRGRGPRRDLAGIAFASSEVPSRYFYSALGLRARLRDVYHNLRRDLRARARGVAWRKEKLVHLEHVQRVLHGRGRVVAEAFDAETFYRRNDLPRVPVHFAGHHRAHAETAYYFSGFDRCLVVTADGAGDGQSHVSWEGTPTGLRPLAETPQAASPGYFYGDVTVVLGFQMMRHEGKVTGLAAFGDPGRLYEAMRKAFRLGPDGTRFVNDFEDDVRRRRPYLAELAGRFSREDVSAAAQQALEDPIVEHVRRMVAKTGLRRVALSGGVFANVKLNQRVMELPEVEEIFVFPGMGDEGLSVGAVLTTLRDQCPAAYRPHRLADVYWGPAFDAAAIESALKRSGQRYARMTEEERPGRVAALLQQGKIVGLFQGRMEFGPRALGHRSILASPKDKSINDWLNRRLDRSEFMPFAPSALAEFGESLFHNYTKGASTARFMTVTYTVRDEWVDKIPAVVHVDQTCRPQMVHRSENARYYDILQAYYDLTGLPLVLNTSFNVHEEPIICRPEEALRALREERIDVLVLEDYLVERR